MKFIEMVGLSGLFLAVGIFGHLCYKQGELRANLDRLNDNQIKPINCKVINIDNCEYLLYDNMIVHKANCTNSFHSIRK